MEVIKEESSTTRIAFNRDHNGHVIDINISDLHNGGVLNAHDICFLQQSDLKMFRKLQTRNRAEAYNEAG